MRIIAGTARGRRLASPPGRTTRPILDALKERVFNVLGESAAKGPVWDLFAGAGSMGLEALSRGAPACVLVERDRRTLETLRRNVATLGFDDRARVVPGDALRPERLPPDPVPALVFVDPPFPMVESRPETVTALIETLGGMVAERGLIVVRVPSRFEWPRQADGVRVVDRREQGVNRVELYSVR